MAIGWIVFLVVVALAAGFWLGARYGKNLWADELKMQGAVAAKLRKERDEAKALIGKVKAAAATAQIDVKKVFPWLVLLLAFGAGAFVGL